MNKILKGLLVSVLAVSAAYADSHDHTNKTFLMPRPHGVNLPMEYTTFKELVNRKAEDKFGGNFSVTPFYMSSHDNHDIAKYFLVNNKSTIALTEGTAFSVAKSDATDVDIDYIIHNPTPGTTAVEASVSLDPEQTAYGVRFDYHQDLDKILKGLYLKVDLPVVHVENDVDLKVASSSTYAAGVTAPAPAGNTSVKDALEKVFKGEFSTTSAAGNDNSQAKLQYAKMAGEQDETGVADIDVALGYKFLNKENYHAALALAITIPTGNEADGVYVFEPIVGNGKHFGLGGDLWADARVWGDYDHNIKLHLQMKYRYLFESDEKRTLGVKGYKWGQYHLLDFAGRAADGQLIHAANVTTLDVDVTPGSQFDGILGLAYNNGGFSFDLGYNMYFREAEDIHIKGNFVDNRYVISARNKDPHVATATPPAVGDVDGGALVYVNKDTLDISTAETPSQFTHSIYGGLGYIFKEWDTPLMLGVGGKYEWPSKNSALEQWGVWGKIGIGF